MTRKITITETAIEFEGFEYPVDVPPADADALHAIRALAWALERIIQVTSGVEAEKRRRNELAAQALQAKERMRQALH